MTTQESSQRSKDVLTTAGIDVGSAAIKVAIMRDDDATRSP